MFFFRRPAPAAPVTASPSAGTAAADTLKLPVEPLPTLAQHGKKMWEKAYNYAQDFVRDRSDPKLAAALILRVSKDIEIVTLKDRREVPMRHPALIAPAIYKNERGKEIPFTKVVLEALKHAEFEHFSLYPKSGDLVARTPSGRWSVKVSEVIPDPWYTALISLGQTAKGSKGLDRYSYHAKLYLIPNTDAATMTSSPRTMTQRHSLKTREVRFFKGLPEDWKEL